MPRDRRRVPAHAFGLPGALVPLLLVLACLADSPALVAADSSCVTDADCQYPLCGDRPCYNCDEVTCDFGQSVIWAMLNAADKALCNDGFWTARCHVVTATQAGYNSVDHQAGDKVCVKNWDINRNGGSGWCPDAPAGWQPPTQPPTTSSAPTTSTTTSALTTSSTTTPAPTTPAPTTSSSSTIAPAPTTSSSSTTAPAPTTSSTSTPAPTTNAVSSSISTPAPSVVISISLLLPMSLDEFDEEAQNLLVGAIAQVMDVNSLQVSIAGITAKELRRSGAAHRLLLAQGVQVDIEITTEPPAAAPSIDAINAQLALVGLPQATLNDSASGVIITECPKDTYQQVNVSSSCIPCPEGSSTYDVTGATSADQCLKITEPPDFICQCHVPLWLEFHDCNHHPTWVNMMVRLPYAQADFPEDSFKTAIGGAVFGGGPEEDIANRRLEVLSATVAGSDCGGVPSVDVKFVVRAPEYQAPRLTSPDATAAQPVQAKLTTANINVKLAEQGVSHICTVVSEPIPVSRGSNC